MPAAVTIRAIGTTATAGVSEPDALLAARATLVRELRALDLACSRFRPDSELHALNAAGGGPHAVGELLWEAVVAALEAARRTDGLVDPTVGRAMRLAGYDRTFSRLESGSPVVTRFVPAGRWREIEVDPEHGTVCLPPGVELDLGAAAKAHAADRIAARIHGETGAGALVSIGGDLSIAGRAPVGGWLVGIDDDHRTAPGRAGTHVSVRAGGLASSGVRVRRWRTASGEMHHILDPRTGRPAQTPWSTVTVAGATCLDANAASTAAIVLGANAPGWLAERGLPARLSRPDGSAVCIAGWPAGREAA
jgi:thiamine biosynthesis lipoprotein